MKPLSMKPLAMKTSKTQRGYTAVEVLFAMTLFAIGAAGVISMQKVTIQGGEDARRYDIATNIAHEWTQRVQRDAMYWTQPNAFQPLTENIGSTRWLKDVNRAVCNDATYCTPVVPGDPPEGMRSFFDQWGRDREPGSNDHVYCVQYRMQWIVPLGTAPNLSMSAEIRVELRVFWARLDRNPINDCTAATPDAANANQLYHFEHFVTAVRHTPPQCNTSLSPGNRCLQ